VPVLRWSPTTWRKMAALRDRIMRGHGTDEPWYLEAVRELEGETGIVSIAAHWRKPLSLAEVAQMAPTPEVKQRPGRA
jgi:hypothetical protein